MSSLPVTVTSPVGEPVPAVILLVGTTAYLESAQAVGLPLVDAERRDPRWTTSRGVGELVAAALAAGARRIVVGLGGSATNDAGAGALVGLARALGLPGPADALDAGGGTLGAVTPDDLAGLRALRDRLRASSSSSPPTSTSRCWACTVRARASPPRRGRRPSRRRTSSVRSATSRTPPRRPSGTPCARTCSPAPGRPRRPRGSRRHPARAPRAGWASGSRCSARGWCPGAVFVADAVGLGDLIADHDVVVTGEGRFDWQSLHGKVVSEVASRALPHAVPTVVVAGEVLVGRREQSAAGITAAYAVGETPEQVAAALAAPAQTLAARAARVARTWSR